MRTCAVLVLLAAFLPAARLAADESAPPHVRPLDRLASLLITEGRTRSATFARVLASLDRAGDLVIYVTTQPTGLSAKGALRFLSHDPWHTYVLIQIDPRQTGMDRLAVLAHELWHALEVAAARPAVTSEAAFAQLYRHIGFDFGRTFESEPACATARAVLRDLAAATRPAR